MTVFVIGVVIVMMNLKRVITCLSSAKSFRAHCSGFPASDFTTLVHARSCFQQKNPLHTAQRPTDKQLAIRWEFTAVKLRAKLWSEAELRFRSSPAVFTASDRQTDSTWRYIISDVVVFCTSLNSCDEFDSQLRHSESLVLPLMLSAVILMCFQTGLQGIPESWRKRTLRYPLLLELAENVVQKSQQM